MFIQKYISYAFIIIIVSVNSLKYAKAQSTYFYEQVTNLLTYKNGKHQQKLHSIIFLVNNTSNDDKKTKYTSIEYRVLMFL